MNMKLIDEKTGILLLDEVVMQMPSYRRIMEDSVVTAEELKEQADTVLSLFAQMDKKLDEDEKELAYRAIAELAVLFELYAGKREE